MTIIKIEDFLVQKGRSSRPIPHRRVIEFINKEVSPKYLYDENIVPKFVNEYYEWVQSSKLNQLSGLEKFGVIDFVHGTSQAFDFFFMKHHKKTFQVL